MPEDVLLNESLDISISDGDFLIGDELEQRCFLILKASKGHFRQNPIIGAAFQNNINGVFTSVQTQDIQLQLLADDIKVNSITLTNGQLIIDAQNNG